MTTLDPKEAFLHVINDHRWLAASGCAWNLVGPKATSGAKGHAHKLLPNIDVMILDSLLLHARSLIDFYTKNPAQARATDIVLGGFSVSIDQKHRDELARYKRPIEVHLLHLTDWRSTNYRGLHATGSNVSAQRPDWNQESSQVVDLILEALKCASKQPGSWQQPFRELYDASSARYRDKDFVWPRKLCEKPDVVKYLKGLDL